MSAIYGVLGLADSQRAYVNDVGHKLVFDAIKTVLAMYNEEVGKLFNLLVERDIEEHDFRYMLPIGGMSQPLGEDAPPASIKPYGYWTCQFPIRGWGDAKSFTRLAQGYLTVQQLDAVLDSIMHRDWARQRRRLLTAIFEDDCLTWLDPTQNNASLSITRLANGTKDSQVYPPVLGSDTEAVDDHFSESAYAISAISATNDPVVTLRDEIIQHFGGRGVFGENIVILHNADATAYLEAISGWVGNKDLGVVLGEDTAYAKSALATKMPGRLHGRLDGCWLCEYAWIPATYMVGVHLEHPPLMRRIDPSYTGLGKDLQLVAQNQDYPLTSAYFEHRYGFAAGNRLSAAVMEVSGGGGTYAPPTNFAE